MGWYGGSSGGGTLSDPPYTIEGNPTSATANTTAFTIGSLTAKTVPASTDQLMLQDNAASGALKSVPWSSMPGAGGGMSIGGAVTGGTTGSVLFVGSGPVLAQDNANFFWNDTNDILLAGKQLNLLVNAVSVPALYPIYNATANNWFIGHAGNASMTGNGNIGIGDSALVAVTTGTLNFGIGTNCLQSITTNTQNVALGSAALKQIVAGGGDQNTGIGGSAGIGLHTGWANTFIGFGAGFNLGGNGNESDSNTFIGKNAGSNITDGSNNTLIGQWSGPSGSLSSVVALSDGAGNLLLDYNYTTANAWSIQNGTNGQVVSIYNTLSGSNYEKLSVDWTALGTNTPLIWTQKGGTGTDRQIWFQSRYSGDTLRLQFGDNSPNGAFGSGCGLTSDSPNVTKLWVRSDNGNNNAGNTGAASLQFLNTARDSIEFVIYDRSTAGTAYGFSIAGRGFLKAVPQTDLILANGSNGIVAIVANAAEVARFSPDKTFGQATQTVASLPAAGTAGRRAFVTDANATTFASIVAGGGANKISVYDDGTNWRIG